MLPEDTQLDEKKVRKKKGDGRQEGREEGAKERELKTSRVYSNNIITKIFMEKLENDRTSKRSPKHTRIVCFK